MFKFDNPLLRDGFAQIPNAVMRVKVLSLQEKALYGLLLSYAWKDEFCFPSQETLAEDLNVSRRYIITLLQSLEKKKFLEVERRGLRLPNIYHFLDFYSTRKDLFTAKNSDVNRGSHPKVNNGSHSSEVNRGSHYKEILKERIRAYINNTNKEPSLQTIEKWKDKLAKNEPIF